MEDGLLDRLARSLVKLESHGPRLDDLLFPQQALADGAPPSRGRPGSKPPLALGIVDLKAGVEQCLTFWARELANACPHRPRAAGRRIDDLARWLREGLGALEAMPWAEAAALEIIEQALLVVETVDAAPRSQDISPPAEGTTRVIASWLSNYGRPVSRATLLRAIEANELASMQHEDGTITIRFADALAFAEKRAHLRNHNLDHLAI